MLELHRHRDQHGIAGGMTVAVVDALEMIQVDQQERMLVLRSAARQQCS